MTNKVGHEPLDEVSDLVCQPVLCSLLVWPLALMAAVGTAGWWRLAGRSGTADWWAVAVPVGVAIGGTLGSRGGKAVGTASVACWLLLVWLAGVVLPTWLAVGGGAVGRSAYVWATLLIAGATVAAVGLAERFLRWRLRQALACAGTSCADDAA